MQQKNADTALEARRKEMENLADRVYATYAAGGSMMPPTLFDNVRTSCWITHNGGVGSFSVAIDFITSLISTAYDLGRMDAEHSLEEHF